MLVMGVRSSWLTLDTKASLTWSTSCSPFHGPVLGLPGFGAPA
jgi:hypothetical protein